MLQNQDSNEYYNQIQYLINLLKIKNDQLNEKRLKSENQEKTIDHFIKKIKMQLLEIN